MEAEINQSMPHQVFTDRQQEVLALMLRGMNHCQIATELGRATLTIQRHIVDIWDRLCEPRNEEFSLALLHNLCEGRFGGMEQVVAFCRLRIRQRFQHQGQLYEKVDRVRDRLGTYNAATIAGKRTLFLPHTLVEVIPDE